MSDELQNDGMNPQVPTDNVPVQPSSDEPMNAPAEQPAEQPAENSPEVSTETPAETPVEPAAPADNEQPQA